MRKLIAIITLTVLFVSTNLSAQIISILPSNASVDSTITLVYDASQGNGELDGYTGDIYMHTGVITTESNGSDIFFTLEQNYTTSTYESYDLSGDTLAINCNDGHITITPFNQNIINIFSSADEEENEISHSTIAEKQLVSTNFIEEGNLLKFSTDSVEVIINKTNLSFEFVFDNDTILHFDKIYEFENQGVLISELKQGERIYGSGSRAIEMDRRGRNLAINNQANYGYGAGAENLNITLPIINSSENYMLYFDNHSIASLDIGSMSEDKMRYTFTNGQADLFVIAGDNHNELVYNYSFLTGYQPMPPLWSLGYIQSKFGYETQNQANAIVDQLINEDFPLDALILDLYWFGNTNTMGNLNWDYNKFPNPTTMMSNFKAKGVKTILITEPYFTLNSSNYSYADQQGYFAKNSNEETYVLWGFWAGDAALLDLFNPEVPAWFNRFYTDRVNEGVAGWWTDLGEPESHPSDMIHFNDKTSSEIHNIYSLEWNKIVYENWKSEFPEKRLFNLSRSGFAGMQRYSTFPWSGDIQRSFEGLRVQVPIMLSLGLNGIPYMHSDVGGFTGGWNDDELFTRWVQMGVFAPIFRIHGTGIETAPTAYGTEAKNIARKYIKWRYELLPYNYTLAYESSAFGTPLARPMDYYDTKNDILQNQNEQYFWGDNMLIAPVLDQDQTVKQVLIPEGKWINYHDMQEYDGPAYFNIPAPLSDIPVLIKAGSFIPTVKDLQSTDEYTSEELLIQYFPDLNIQSSSYTLFDDDKSNPNSLIENEYNLIYFDGFCSGNEIEIQINSNEMSYAGMPIKREFTFELYRIVNNPESVSLDNLALNEFSTIEDLDSQESGYYFNQSKHQLYVKIPYSHSANTIRIENIDISGSEESEDPFAELYVYPNPGKNNLLIGTSTTDNTSYQLKITDLSGKIVINNNINLESRYQLNTSEWSSGVYFIQIINNEYSTIIKWLKL